MIGKGTVNPKRECVDIRRRGANVANAFVLNAGIGNEVANIGIISVDVAVHFIVHVKGAGALRCGINVDLGLDCRRRRRRQGRDDDDKNARIQRLHGECRTLAVFRFFMLYVESLSIHLLDCNNSNSNQSYQPRRSIGDKINSKDGRFVTVISGVVLFVSFYLCC